MSLAFFSLFLFFKFSNRLYCVRNFSCGRNKKSTDPQNIFSAIWLLSCHNHYGSWPRSGEIDIMESRGKVKQLYPREFIYQNLFGSRSKKSMFEIKWTEWYWSKYEFDTGDGVGWQKNPPCSKTFQLETQRMCPQWKRNNLDLNVNNNLSINSVNPSSTGNLRAEEHGSNHGVSYVASTLHWGPDAAHNAYYLTHKGK